MCDRGWSTEVTYSTLHLSQGSFSWLSTHACGLRCLTLTTGIVHRFLPHLLAICSTSLINFNIYFKSIYSITWTIRHRTTVVPLCYDTVPVEVDFPGLPSLKQLRLYAYTGNDEQRFLSKFLSMPSASQRDFSNSTTILLAHRLSPI